MTSNSIRAELIEWLSSVESDELLSLVKNVKDSFYFNESNNQQLNESLSRAIKDVKNNRLTDYNEFI